MTFPKGLLHPCGVLPWTRARPDMFRLGHRRGLGPDDALQDSARTRMQIRTVQAVRVALIGSTWAM